MNTTDTWMVEKLKPTYEIDFEKVNSIEDIKNILKALSFNFTFGDDWKEKSPINYLLKEVWHKN